MSVIKKFNPVTDRWEPVMSNKAQAIETDDPSLIHEPEEEGSQSRHESVEESLVRHESEISLMKKNIAWLAQHGGGGSGGGGSDEGSTTLTILENGQSVSYIVWSADKTGISYRLTSSKASTRYTITITLDSQPIYSAQNVQGSEDIKYCRIANISAYSKNDYHNLRIIVQDQYDNITTAEVLITESNIILEADKNMNVNISDIASYSLQYRYRSSMNGTYVLYWSNSSRILENLDDAFNTVIEIRNNQSNSIQIPFTGLVNMQQVKAGDTFTVYAVLKNNNENIISAVVSTTVNITSSTELTLTSISLSIDPTKCTIVPKSNVLYTNFIAYLNGASNFTYYVTAQQIEVVETGEGQDMTVTINRIGTRENLIDPANARLSQYEISNTVMFPGFPSDEGYGNMFQPGNKYEIIIHATNYPDRPSKDLYCYIEVTSSGGGSIPIGDDDKVIMNYSVYGGSSQYSESNWVSQNTGFRYNNIDGYTVSSRMKSWNIGGQSGRSDKGPFVRFCNKAYAQIQNILLKNPQGQTVNATLFQRGSGNNQGGIIYAGNPHFTISLAYLTNFSSSDDHTVLNMGRIFKDSNGNYVGKGILINNHDYIIKFDGLTMSGKLLDSTFNQIDIVFNDEIFSESGKVVGFLKVYHNGVLLNAINFDKISKDPKQLILDFGDITTIEIAHRLELGLAENICDVNLYGFKMFSTSLNPYQIVCNYINNYLIYTMKTTESGQEIDSEILNEKLNANMIVYNDRTQEYSCALWDTNMNSFNDKNWISITSNSVTLRDGLAQACPLPIMVLDLSHNDEWTFAGFKSDMSAKTISTCQAPIYYFINGVNQMPNNTVVDVDVQGTTTKGYAIKNLNIDFGANRLFWVKSSWFPEQIYTLKADIVDSAHANNACIGKFINEAAINGGDILEDTPPMEYFKNAPEGVFELPNNKQGLSIKHTLEGFPILLIGIFKGTTANTVDIRSLGIYSFNLGRDSYFNMGFKILKRFRTTEGNIVTSQNPPMLLGAPQEAVDVIDCQCESWEGRDSYNCTQINMDQSGHNYNPPLQPIEEGYPIRFDGYFWSSIPSHIQHFWECKYPDSGQSVTNIKRMFEFIVKNSPYSQGGVNLAFGASLHEYEYIVEDNAYKLKPTTGDFFISRANVLAKEYISTTNARFYFIMCMLAGLVDNLGKNMNVRVWKNRSIFPDKYQRWYTCFYDMDDAFGEDNVGLETIQPDAYVETITNVGNNIEFGMPGVNADASRIFTVFTNKLWGVLDNVEFNDQYEAEFNAAYNRNDSLYAAVWNKMRNKLIMNVDAFIDMYFMNQVSECGELLYNQDFNVKYINTAQIDFMHGNRHAFVYDWVNKRIKFLDSLFGYMNRNSETEYLNNLTNIVDASYNKRVRFVHNSGTTTLKVKTNSPVILRTTIGSNNIHYAYVRANEPTDIIFANTGNSTNIQTTINNADLILDIENLKALKICSISSETIGTSEVTIENQYGALSAFETFDLSGNTSFSSANTPIDFTTLFRSWNTAAVPSQFSDYAKSPEPYQLRKINLSNTKSANVSRFDINLNGSNIEDEPPISYEGYRNPYTNLTDIDISNSCVTSIDLPSSVSLFTLILTNSSIVQVRLSGQSILPGIDFSGCTALQTISLNECKKFSTLTLTQLPLLSKVELSNCSVMTSVSINLQNSRVDTFYFACAEMNALKTVSIINCSASNTTLDLSGAKNLQTLILTASTFNSIKLPVECRATLKTLNLNQSTVRNIYWVASSQSGNVYIPDYTDYWDEDTKTGDGIIDLIGCTKLFTNNGFECIENTGLKYVRVENIQGSPIHLNKPMRSCSDLRRFFGNIVVDCNRMFEKCTHFSIHGSNLQNVSYNGVSPIQNGVVKHPFEMGPNVVTGDDVKTATVVFQEGDEVTNLTFGTITNASNTSYSSVLSQTSVTLFDVYYTLYNLGTLRDLTYLFYGCNNINFRVTVQGDTITNNSPHKWMFSKCGNVTSIAWIFYSCSAGRYILPSPTNTQADESVSVSQNDGLFSYLTNCTSIRGAFYSCGSFYIDRALFRFVTGSGTKVTNLGYFRPVAIARDVNDAVTTATKWNQMILYCYNPWDCKPASDNAHYIETGNLTGFFDQFYNGVSTIDGMFFKLHFVDFRTIKVEVSGNTRIKGIPNPNNISLTGFLYCNYAVGDITPADFFQQPGKVQGVYHSFVCLNSGTNPKKIGSDGKYTDESSNKNLTPYPKFTINVNTFSQMTALTAISCQETGDFAVTDVLNNSSFSGPGTSKIIDIDTAEDFHSILGNNKLLSKVTALFANTAFKKDIEELQLPGTMFNEHTKISDIRYLFYNIGIKSGSGTLSKYRLTKEGFKDCPSLNNVSYAFGCSSFRSGKLEGYIPHRFLYHGQTQETKTISGVYEDNYEEEYLVFGTEQSDYYYNIESTQNKLIQTVQIIDTNDDEQPRVTTTRITYTGVSGIEAVGTEIRTIPNTDIEVEMTVGKFLCTPITRVQSYTTVYENGILTHSEISQEQQYGNYKNIQPTPIEVTYPKMKNNVTNASYMFCRQTISAYQNNEPSIENNPSYQPFKYTCIQNASTRTWMQEEYIPQTKTFMWEYDGENLPSLVQTIVDAETSGDSKRLVLTSTYEWLDEITPYLIGYELTYGDGEHLYQLNISPSITYLRERRQVDPDNPGNQINKDFDFMNESGTLKFMCPPDLFRYIYNAETSSIDGVFYGCGQSASGNKAYVTGADSVIKNDGCKGRIVPWLLKPIPLIASIRGLFYQNRNLSYYIESNDPNEQNSNCYMIPRTFFSYAPDIINLVEAFGRMAFPNKIYLNVFDSLRGYLNLERCFYQCFWRHYVNEETNITTPAQVDGVFKTRNVSNIQACFSMSLKNSSDDPANYVGQNITTQQVRFNDVFKANQASGTATDYFVFFGSSNYSFGTKTLSRDASHYNYAVNKQ